ncbi:MAG: hypothetical protein K2O97_09105, partial [Acetatifactor sp.]|nr:hypothetical protein [Acetatifactor sp.]
FSSSKLSEMLTLPDNEIQLITERTTKREIRELKEFNRQEIGHGTGEGSGQDGTPLEKCLIDFFRDKEEMLNGIMGYLGADPPGYREAMERMNPSGQASHKKGIVFLFLYDWATGIRYKLLTQPEPVSMTWSDLLQAVFRIYGGYEKENIWQDFYGERNAQEKEDTIPPQPVRESGQSVAMSQREGGQELPEGGTDRTGSMKGELPGAMEEQPAAVIKGTPAAAVEGTGETVPEEQLPGQMDVYDYPEMIPEEERRDGHGTDTGRTADDGYKAPGTEEGPGSGEEEADDVPEPHEIPGTAEDDGCAGDPATEEEAWMEAGRAEEKLRQYFAVWDGKERDMPGNLLRSVYHTAIDLAAAIEKVMIRRDRDHE